MSEEQKMTETEFHKKMAVELFNKTCDILDKRDRTSEESEKMILTSYSSAYHWSVIGEPINLQRGHWLISHVYAIMGRGMPALYNAQRCLNLTEANNIGDFDAAFAYEAMAVAYALLGNKPEYEKYYRMATEAGEKIKEKEDRDYFYVSLEQGPWYGMK